VGGVPIRLPALHVHTVGGGGGSLAWRDDGAALRVGPQSAGAHLGPARYDAVGPGDRDGCQPLARPAPNANFGGAGLSHAYQLAEELELRRVLVPARLLRIETSGGG
jgi:N-methylhydantoinase A/oxoprolinase/acetone carboxylase beta subunit